MSFFSHQPWMLSTLSPVHLGTGLDYEFTSYLIDDGVMYCFGESALFDALSPIQLAQISDYADKGVAGLKSIHALLHTNREVLKLHASHLVAIGEGVEQFYSKRKAGTDKDFNQMLLPKTASEPFSGSPVLPGTALKGAIRTAWLDWKVHSKPQVAPKNESRPLKILQQVTEFEKVDKDPFKTLRIADARAVNAQVHKKIVLFSSHDWIDAKKSKSARVGMVEAVAAGQVDAFEMDWRLWFNQDVKPPVEDLTQLATLVNRFYLPILQEELARNAQTGYYAESYASALSQLLHDHQLQQLMAQGQAMLLRLGRYSGAVSKTLNDHRKIKILGQKGAPNQIKSLPHEQRLVVSGEKNVSGSEPFGWVLLVEQGLTPAAVKMFAATLYDQDAQLQKLAEVAASQQHNREQYQLEQQQRLEREQAYAAEQAAKAEKLAAMSDNQQQMFGLQERMEKGESKGKGPSEKLWGDLRGLIQICDVWPAAERQQLLQLAKALVTHLGIDLKKSKKAKELVKQLEG